MKLNVFLDAPLETKRNSTSFVISEVNGDLLPWIDVLVSNFLLVILIFIHFFLFAEIRKTV